MRSHLASFLIATSVAIVACSASVDSPQAEGTGVAAEALNGCPGNEEPCTCSGGPSAGLCACTINVLQCRAFCAGRAPSLPRCGPRSPPCGDWGQPCCPPSVPNTFNGGCLRDTLECAAGYCMPTT